MPMVFDLRAGLYWRLEEDGLLFGWSDPDGWRRMGLRRHRPSGRWFRAAGSDLQA